MCLCGMFPIIGKSKMSERVFKNQLNFFEEGNLVHLCIVSTFILYT